MIIHQATYVQSVVDWRKCPDSRLPEYAFIGRSNVGKSSLINMLTGNGSLAKTSSKPGKTQTINHFLIDNSWYLVDLPGYGYAGVSKTMREKWRVMIDEYLMQRPNLQLVFVLVDSRLEPQRNDLDFINRMGAKGIPTAIIFTKTDKISNAQMQRNVQIFKNKLLETWEEVPPCFLSSAENGRGREQICDYIGGLNETYVPQQ
ncbi:MAG: YihA family ribosome biogenesis GTP-binding protein [Bacteroidales bacterium]|nr:YihA family ribosome biogenesis GTP-binding protein [Bacteroidales bacterium]MCR5114759.1 ribosome biogenesis GTP-binding protein YihA/YsxC [Bacteroidales bacterium]